MLPKVNQSASPAGPIDKKSEQPVQPVTAVNSDKPPQQYVSTSAPDFIKMAAGDRMKHLPKVVMIDDDKDLLSVLSTNIESGGFEVLLVPQGDLHRC